MPAKEGISERVEFLFRKEDSGPYKIYVERLNLVKEGVGRVHPMSVGKMTFESLPEISKTVISIKTQGRNRIVIEVNN